MRALALAATLAALALAPAAHAASITFDYDRDLASGVQTTGKPIDQSTIGLRFDAKAGNVTWGWEGQHTQTGRAGMVYTRVGAHMGYPVDVKGVVVTPTLEAGYAQALDDVFAYGCLRADVSHNWNSTFSSEGYVRGCHSIPGTVNTSPLNASDLRHDSFSEARFEVHPLVVKIVPQLQVGVKFARVTGSGMEIPASDPTVSYGVRPTYNVVGIFTRASF